MSQLSKPTGYKLAAKLENTITTDEHVTCGKFSVIYDEQYQTFNLAIRGEFIYLPSGLMKIINAKFSIRSIIVNGDLTTLVMDYKGAQA